MPGEGHMLVTFGAVETAAGDTDTVASHMDQQLDDLKSYLSPLVATWSGQASTEYQALQSQWDRSASELNVILREIANTLRAAHANYTQAERANTAIWAGG